MVVTPWVAAPSCRLLFVSSCLLLGAGLPAQTDSRASGEAPPAVDSRPTSEGGSVAESATAESSSTGVEPAILISPVGMTGPFARIEREVELKVWSTELSPHYSEKLSKGTVVRVGDVQRSFREVILPFGVVGFVHQKFTTALDNGRVRSTTKLAFRYRPQVGEAPVAFVDADQEFVVTGADGDWWMVRFAEQRAWVPIDALLTFEGEGAGSDATLAGAYAELARQHLQVSEEFFGEIAERKRLDTLAAARAAKLEGLRGAFATELDKPVGEQQLDGVRAEVEKFLSTLEPDTDAHAIAVRFRDRIDTQKTIAEATKFVHDTTRKPAPAVIDADKARPEIDPLARFDAIGWLRCETSLGGDPSAALMKGGQVLHHLTCSTGRYDLRMFDGLEVGMNGPRDRQNWQSLRTLDVERIEVLRSRMN